MDRERTRQYYAAMTEEDICQCDYCRTYAKRIRDALPEMASYLQSLGVDIEKPFEVIPLYEEEGEMLYTGAQYLVCGSPDDFSEARINGVSVVVTDSHPVSDLQEEHFVIEIQADHLIRLKSLFPKIHQNAESKRG